MGMENIVRCDQCKNVAKNYKWFQKDNLRVFICSAQCFTNFWGSLWEKPVTWDVITWTLAEAEASLL